MNTAPAEHESAVATVLRQLVLPLFPAALRQDIETELPIIALQAHQVGVNVLVAESKGLRFSEAVMRPEFLAMGRIYFGASNLLQWQLPPAVRALVRDLLGRAFNGDFESARRLLFAIASRKDDPEAALLRFLLWVAVRINLLVLTWRNPGPEARGSLQEAVDHAESTLRALLEGSRQDLQAADFRPLHVLVADALVQLRIYDQLVADGLLEVSSELYEIVTNADALEVVRSLDAKSAVMFHPGESEGPMGSQQITDRYPQWFPSANALEQGRSRALRKRLTVRSATNRFIDVVQEVMGNCP